MRTKVNLHIVESERFLLSPFFLFSLFFFHLFVLHVPEEIEPVGRVLDNDSVVAGFFFW